VRKVKPKFMEEIESEEEIEYPNFTSISEDDFAV